MHFKDKLFIFPQTRDAENDQIFLIRKQKKRELKVKIVSNSS